MFKRILVVFIMIAAPSLAVGQFAPFEGTWEWVQTEYSDGEITTPGSLGFTEQFLFGTDQIFVRYIDEQVIYEDVWDTGEAVIGQCMVEFLYAEAETWVWSIEEGDVQYLRLQVGFECPIGGGTPVSKVSTFFS